MKVKELKKILEQYDENMDCYYSDGENYTPYSLTIEEMVYEDELYGINEMLEEDEILERFETTEVWDALRRDKSKRVLIFKTEE